MGLAIETGWDIANVGMGAVSFAANVASGNWLGAAADGLGLAYDGVATAVPGLPGGAATGLAIYRGSKLGRNLANAGRGAQKGVEVCHHIVAAGAKKAQAARDALKRWGIDVDDAVNGITLPKGFHQGMHTDDYFDVVNTASKRWESATAARSWLAEFGHYLQQAAQ